MATSKTTVVSDGLPQVVCVPADEFERLRDMLHVAGRESLTVGGLRAELAYVAFELDRWHKTSSETERQKSVLTLDIDQAERLHREMADTIDRTRQYGADITNNFAIRNVVFCGWKLLDAIGDRLFAHESHERVDIARGEWLFAMRSFREALSEARHEADTRNAKRIVELCSDLESIASRTLPI